MGLLLEALPPLSGFDLAFSDSVTLTLDHCDIGVMGEPIQQGRYRSRVGKDRIPFLERFVC